MSGIRGKGRRGHTVVPNWRWEDQSLNCYELRIAGWLVSHADQWREDFVSRNLVAERTGISRDKTSQSVRRLVELGILHVKSGGKGRFVITVDFDVWETPPTSTHPVNNGVDEQDQPDATRPVTGRHTSSDRTPHVHIEEQGEEQRETPQPPAQGGGRERPSRKQKPPEPLTPLERSDDFDAWYAEYPRKQAKLDAIRAWRVMLGYLPSVEQLIGASHELRERTRREASDPTQWERFLPLPSTWLRRGDYLDYDVETATVAERRHPCVLCGVSEPCEERCEGVNRGVIEDVATECVWRTTS